MNNKIVLTKRTSAIFLAIVLVTGTITALSSPSFMTASTAQAQPYYNGMDIYDKPYEKDDRDKSKKDSKNVNINKLKCINNNININGNNAGNISIGNKGQGYLGAYSSGSGYGDEGYSKQGKGFDCIINNNNTNTNIVADSGNATDGNVTDTCEECFLDALGPQGLAQFEAYLATAGFPVPENLIAYCTAIQGAIDGGATPAIVEAGITADLTAAGIVITVPEINALVACLFEVLGGWTDNNTKGLVPFDINTDNSADSDQWWYYRYYHYNTITNIT